MTSYQPVGAGWIPSSLSRLNPFEWLYWSSSSNSTTTDEKIDARSDNATNVILEPIVDRFGDRQNGLRNTIPSIKTMTTTIHPSSDSFKSPSTHYTSEQPFEPGSVLRMFTTTTVKPKIIAPNPIDQLQNTPRIKLRKKGRMHDYSINPIAFMNSSSHAIAFDSDIRQIRLRTEDNNDKKDEFVEKTPLSINNSTSTNANNSSTSSATSRLAYLFSGWWSRGNSNKASKPV